MPGNTWWTTLGGTAFHEVTEVVDLNEHMGVPLTYDEAVALLPQALEDAIDYQAQRYPHDTIKPSGRVTKEVGWSGGPNKKDRAWVEHFLPIMLQQYMDWRAETGWRVAEFDGTPAIELPIDVNVVHPETGEVLRVVGSIDRVFTVPFRGLFVVDIKTGAVPASVLQPATYGVGLSIMHGARAKWGAYWSPSRDGGRLVEHRIDRWDDDSLSRLYLSARQGMEAGIFLPNITDLCRGCGVRDYCWGFSGSKAHDAMEKLNETRTITTLPAGSVPAATESE